MSTRCLIGLETSDGKCRAIYCHFDGYPTGVGFELVRNYTTAKQVENLIALGDMSSLGKTPDACDTYNNEKYDERNAPETFKNRDGYFKSAYERDTEYCYLYTKGTWLYSCCRRMHEEPEWRRADLIQLDREYIAAIDAYCEERRRRLRNAGYAV